MFYLTLILVAAFYYVAAKLGLQLAFIHPSASPLWPATGIALASLMLGGRRLWPAIFVGAFLANLSTPASILTAIGIASGNTLEALVGVSLVHRFAQGRDVFERPENIFRWTVFCAVLGSAISASIGTSSVVLTGYAKVVDFPAIWFTWWLGDAGGALVVAPFLILWGRQLRITVSAGKVAEAILVFAAFITLGGFVFGVPFRWGLSTYPLPFSLPLLVWVAFRLGPRATATAVMGMSAMAIWGTLVGEGAFAGRSVHESLILLQVFLAVSSATSLVVASAIHDRKTSEEASARLATIVESSDDAIVSKTLDGIVTSWNNGAERLFQYSAEEMIGKSITILIPEHLLNEEKEILSRIGRGEKVDHFETVRRRRDGSLLRISLTISPVKDRQGHITGASKIARDITARKKTEEGERFLSEASRTLSASLDYQRTLREVARLAAERMSDWCTVHVVEDLGVVRHLATHHRDPAKVRWAEEINRRYPSAPESPRGVANVLKTGVSELYSDVPDELLQAGSVDREHYRLLREVGITSAMVVPMHAGGRTLGVITFVSAESKRRYAADDLALAEALADRAGMAIENARLYRVQQDFSLALESQVQLRTVELKEALTELEGFSYTVAHDLRAPIRSLASFSGLLLEDYGSKLDDEGRDYLNRITNAAVRMDALVEDLLSYSRLRKEETPLESVAVEDLVREITGQMESELRDRHAVVRVEGPLLPVLAHRVMLGQALTNLLGNAIKFVHEGVAPVIRIRSERRGGAVRIWVEDNGIGIPTEHYGRIFDIFQRLEPRRFSGTGVGLAIVRKALQRMGGTSGVESTVGEGSRFWMELPSGEKNADRSAEESLGPAVQADPGVRR